MPIKNTIIRLTAAVFILSAGLFSTVHAQTGKFYSSGHDISNSLINSICQDREGYIWTATEDGLNKFDGNKFTVYKHSGSAESITNDYVHSLLCDSKGRMWVGCINGLDRYDYDTDSFSETVIIRDGSVIHPHISSIIETKDGDVWFATSGQNMMVLKKGSDTIEIMKDMPAYIHTLYEDSRGIIWIGTDNEGVFRFSPSTGEYFRYPGRKGDVNPFEISSFCEDRHGTLYVGSIGGGVMKLDRENDIFINIPYHGRNDLHVRSILCNDEGSILIGTDGEGLKILEEDKLSLNDCDIYQEPVNLTGSKVHAMLRDRDGNLWLGLFQKGLCFIPKETYRFRYFGYNSTTRNTIGSSCVTSVFTDRKGIIWVGTDTDGIYTVDENGNGLDHYRTEEGGMATPTSVMAIFETSSGQILTGSYHRGINILNRATSHFNAFPGISRVTAFAEDPDGSIYVSTLGSGIYRLNPETGESTQFTSLQENEDTDWKEDRLHNNWVISMTIDRDGLLWIGTYRGLACYDIRKKSFLSISSVNNLLPDRIIQYLYEDSSGIIWIGSSEGLYSYSKQTGKFTLYTKNDGLPDNVICGIADDSQGSIWISTHHGISKFSPREGTFTNFSEDDGLQGNEFSRGASFRDKDGMILFGGINGVTAFYPQEIVQTPRKLNIVVTDFIVRDRSVRKECLTGTAEKKYSQNTDRYHLKYEDNSFRVEYSAMDFTNPEQILWEHRIKELGKEWISDGPGVNSVSYSYLGSGAYTLQTRASLSGEYSDVLEVSVIIDPPWYLSWWMSVIVAVILAVMILLVVSVIKDKRKHRQELAEKKRLEDINEAKLQYFMNISHEIRNPMTLIVSPLQKLLKEENNPVRKQSLQMMDRNAQRILRLINQLMDTRKIEKGQMMIKCRETDIVSFIDDIKLTFDTPALERGIRFTFKHSEPEMNVWIDLHNFDKVLLNLLSNAFKYTSDGGEIIIELTQGSDPSTTGPLHDWWQVSVTDDGIGLDEDKVEKIFERFYQVPNDITNSYFSTGIGLHLARSLVLLHHGIIKAENRKDTHGSIFTVRMPSGSAHLRPEELERPQTPATVPHRSNPS